MPRPFYIKFSDFCHISVETLESHVHILDLCHAFDPNICVKRRLASFGIISRHFENLFQSKLTECICSEFLNTLNWTQNIVSNTQTVVIRFYFKWFQRLRTVSDRSFRFHLHRAQEWFWMILHIIFSDNATKTQTNSNKEAEKNHQRVLPQFIIDILNEFSIDQFTN